MNSRGSWEGISNASAAGSACRVYGLLCKTDSSLRMLISSRLSSLCEAITLAKPQAPNFFSFNTTPHSRRGGKHTQARHTHPHPPSLCQLEWLIIDVKAKPWWLLHMYTSGEGRSLALPMWHCQTTSPGCLTGVGSWNFPDLHQGPLDRIARPLIPHTVPCRLGRRLPFVSETLLTSTSYCHMVSWGSCHCEQSRHPVTD